jgi:hypothetical protein
MMILLLPSLASWVLFRCISFLSVVTSATTYHLIMHTLVAEVQQTQRRRPVSLASVASSQEVARALPCAFHTRFLVALLAQLRLLACCQVEGSGILEEPDVMAQLLPLLPEEQQTEGEVRTLVWFLFF